METATVLFGGTTSHRGGMLCWQVISTVHQQKAENGIMPKQSGATRNRTLPRISGHHLFKRRSRPTLRLLSVAYAVNPHTRGLNAPTGMPHVRRKGHSANICPSSTQQATLAEEGSAPDASVLAVDDHDNGLISHPGKTVSNLPSDSIINQWICDSGSTAHCSPDMQGFTDYTPQKSPW